MAICTVGSIEWDYSTSAPPGSISCFPFALAIAWDFDINSTNIDLASLLACGCTMTIPMTWRGNGSHFFYIGTPGTFAQIFAFSSPGGESIDSVSIERTGLNTYRLTTTGTASSRVPQPVLIDTLALGLSGVSLGVRFRSLTLSGMDAFINLFPPTVNCTGICPTGCLAVPCTNPCTTCNPVTQFCEPVVCQPNFTCMGGVCTPNCQITPCTVPCTVCNPTTGLCASTCNPLTETCVGGVCQTTTPSPAPGSSSGAAIAVLIGGVATIGLLGALFYKRRKNKKRVQKNG